MSCESYSSSTDSLAEDGAEQQEVVHEAEVHRDQAGSITVLFPRAQMRKRSTSDRIARTKQSLSLYLQELLDISQETDVVLQDLPDLVPDSRRFNGGLRNAKRASCRISYLEVEIPAPEDDQDSIENYKDFTELAAESADKTESEEWLVPQEMLMEYIFQWNPLVAEIEAVEACRWLRAAGFPQYAQMYEDQVFPIDIASVEKDHDFLDKDSIQSLFRRLNTLNKCVTMKIETPTRKNGDDSDEDDHCALSALWKYQSNSKRWSRRDLVSPPKCRLQSSSSHDSVITDNDDPDSPLTPRENSCDRSTRENSCDRRPKNISDSDSVASSVGAMSPSIRRAASEKFKGARNFLKRMESLKTKKKKDLSEVKIGNPVLVDSPEVQQRIDQLGCVDIAPQNSSTKQPSPELQRLHKQTKDFELQTLGYYSLDSDYTPGKFPKSMSSGHNVAETPQRISLYDNLDDNAEVDLSTVDPQEELDRILQELYQNISGLDASLEMAGRVEESAPDNNLNQIISEIETETHDSAEMNNARERRDSGVGSSLTRVSSEDCPHRIRWHSFIQSHRPLSHSVPLSSLSAAQLVLLRKLALLKVTALMEKYSPSNRSGWNWIMPKFMKRWKTPDYSQQKVFGIPLLLVQQRTGQPLPQCILRAMRCLRRTAMDSVGIFRKSGVRSRIQKLRNQMEADPDSVDFNVLQSYDVADVLKQYFRELPECLLTNKLSETFISIFTHVPAEQRLQALQSIILLLPDENRQVLLSLLYFLLDMSDHSHVNQMNASNLAVCFAPSLFNMGSNKSNNSSSPKRSRKATGLPDQKELLDQKAAHLCLTQMITDCKLLFQVPEEMVSKCHLSCLDDGKLMMIDDFTAISLQKSQENMEETMYAMLKEAKDRWRGWVACTSLCPPNDSNIELAYKKVSDGIPLRTWKACIDVEAPPVEVLNRILRERHLWDDDFLQWRIVEKVSSELEVFQYQRSSMAPHPTVDLCELRSWKTGLTKGACALVSRSIEHPAASNLGGAKGVMLSSQYLIEPCGAGKSRLTHISRVDLKGHTTEWYNRCYGCLCSYQLVRIRDSFTQAMSVSDGPETKV